MINQSSISSEALLKVVSSAELFNREKSDESRNRSLVVLFIVEIRVTILKKFNASLTRKAELCWNHGVRVNVDLSIAAIKRHKHLQILTQNMVSFTLYSSERSVCSDWKISFCHITSNRCNVSLCFLKCYPMKIRWVYSKQDITIKGFLILL